MQILNNKPTNYPQFLLEIKERIHRSRYEALKSVNKEIIQLYWDIGRLITEKQQTLGWGKSVVETLSEDLQKEFPGMTGFSARNIWYMQQFYAEYQANEILQPLVAEISWSIRELERQFNTGLFERLAVSKNKSEILEKNWNRAVFEYQIETNLYDRQGKAITERRHCGLDPQSHKKRRNVA